MKKIIKISLVLFLLVPLTFMGCKKNDVTENPNNEGVSVGNQEKNTFVYCGTPQIFQMVDYGETISPATVTIGNDQSQVIVKYQINDPASGWFLYNPRLFVGSEAQLIEAGIATSLNPDGSLYIQNTSLIPNSTFNGSSTVSKEYIFSLENLEDCFIVLAYAEIRKANGERAYIFGKPNLKRPGYYLNYCVQDCYNPPLGGCETAYAFGGNYANCFLNIAGVQSNNWGWSNGPISPGNYTWPIYAGAGQCNTSNGTQVGTLTVNYTPPTATVTYTVFNGYEINATHLYVGNQILPKKNNKFTTAPGQFPYKHNELNGVSTDSYTITGLSGAIYVAAHSEVCDDI